MKRDAQFEKDISAIVEVAKRACSDIIDQMDNSVTLLHEVHKDRCVGCIDEVPMKGIDLMTQLIQNDHARIISNLPGEGIDKHPIVVQHMKGAEPEKKRLYVFVDMEPEVEEGQVGDIWGLTRVQNEADEDYGFDFYHHCPDKEGNLVRIAYRGKIDNHICLVCGQEFYDKGKPMDLHKQDQT